MFVKGSVFDEYHVGFGLAAWGVVGAVDCEGLGVGAEVPVFVGDEFEGAAVGCLYVARDGDVECAVVGGCGLERRGDGA